MIEKKEISFAEGIPKNFVDTLPSRRRTISPHSLSVGCT
jgi:hypothetical protein